MAGEEGDAAEIDPTSVMKSGQFVVLLVLTGIVGLVASLAAWAFLEVVHQLQDGAYHELPDALGFEGTPVWWPVPLLLIAGIVVALAVTRLPGKGGHIPAGGLNAAPTQPIDLGSVLAAAIAGIGLGIVLGPEAPLMALGGGLGFLAVRILRSDAPPEVGTIVATAGIFSGLSFLFGSPLIAAVIVIEAAGLGGKRLPVVLIPGLMAAGIGSLVSIGMGSWTGVDMTAISLSLLPVPDFPRPTAVDALWTIPFAAVVAVVIWAIFVVGRRTAVAVPKRPMLLIPAVGLITAGLAIVFTETTDKGLDFVLFSGQDGLGPLVSGASTWSIGALAVLIACKGIAYAFALGSFRGGPVFPAIFLGAAAGLMAAQLPGFDLTPAIAVGIGAAVVAVLRLPLSAAVLATLLTSQAGLGAGPLIIIGVTVAYLVLLALPDDQEPEPAAPEGAPAAASTASTASRS